jgi:hypothetical protein
VIPELFLVVSKEVRRKRRNGELTADERTRHSANDDLRWLFGVGQYVNHACPKHANVLFRQGIRGVAHTKRIRHGSMLLATYNSGDRLAFGCAVEGCTQ